MHYTLCTTLHCTLHYHADTDDPHDRLRRGDVGLCALHDALLQTLFFFFQRIAHTTTHCDTDDTDYPHDRLRGSVLARGNVGREVLVHPF